MAEAAEELRSEAQRLLTKENVQEALRVDKGTAAILLSWRIKNFTKKGDNYACEVTSIIVQYTLEGVPLETSYVAKMNRVFGSGLFQDMMQSYFVREGTCYLEVFPRMNEILKRAGHHEIRIPKVFYGSYKKGKEVLLLEDLRTRGFRMYDRRRGLDIPHAMLVLKELGRIHAASKLLERILPNGDLAKTWDAFADHFEADENARKMLQTMVSNQLEGAATIVDKVPGYEDVVKWIRQTKDNVVEIFFGNQTSITPFSVLTHGDCWTNNFLFKYDDAGVPVDVMLVDLQYMRRVSLAKDLNYFLYSSFDGPDRKANFQNFLKAYYASFRSVLEAGKEPVPFTYEELRQEFGEHMMYGCVSAMFLIPTALSEDEDVVCLENLTDDNVDKFSEDRQKTFIKMSQKGGGVLRDRLLDTFDEMKEAGIIK